MNQIMIINLGVLFVWGPHMAYYWPCPQGFGAAGGPYVVPKINLGSAVYKASALISILSLQFLDTDKTKDQTVGANPLNTQGPGFNLWHCVASQTLSGV